MATVDRNCGHCELDEALTPQMQTAGYVLEEEAVVEKPIDDLQR